MASKEYIKGVLYNLEEAHKLAKETKNNDLEIDCKMQKEAYNQVLKDLEDYEELKKLMGTPIQEIMKQLKVLEILKPLVKAVIELKGQNINVLDFNISDSAKAKIKAWLDA